MWAPLPGLPGVAPLTPLGSSVPTPPRGWCRVTSPAWFEKEHYLQKQKSYRTSHHLGVIPSLAVSVWSEHVHLYSTAGALLLRYFSTEQTFA